MPGQTGDGESFRGLILQLRGRMGLTQRQLAARLSVHANSVQAWEAGISHPGAASLRMLVAAAVEAGCFTPGAEADEAAALWNAVVEESTRLRTPFDHAWFAGILRSALAPRSQADTAAPPEPASVPAASVEPLVAPGPLPRRQSWGDAPDVARFLGRATEREQLSRWIQEGCRVVGVFGLGGIGKTLLAARLAQDVAPQFDAVYWQSLRDGPAPGEWLGGAIGYLAPDEPPIPTESEQISRLLDLLGQTRCLLVLDNFETILRPGVPGGEYAAGCEAYGSLLRRLGELPHRSCVLLTSREAPPELGVMRGEYGPVRCLDLAGLSVDDGRSLLGDKRLDGDGAAWDALIASCGGNGLALKMTGETILDLFGGSISAYLDYAAAAPGVLIGGVRQLIAGQIERLSDLERDVLRWLAVEREPMGFAELASAFGPRSERSAILQAIEALRRRSLLERGERRAAFLLHSVALEYVTERLIDEVAQEITTAQVHRLLAQPLVKATARDYVRRSQERLIAAPLLERLVGALGDRHEVERQLLTVLDGLRARPVHQQGYGPGNVVNLLWLLRGDLRGLDLSRLAIRQAYLQGAEAQDASLAEAHLAEVVLAEAFRYPTSVTISADGRYVAAGTSSSEVCLWRVADRTLLATLQGHTGGIRSVAISRDNRLIVSGSFDGSVRVWDAEPGQPRVAMHGHTGLVYAVALSADGQIVASGGQDGTVRLWSINGGLPLATLPGHAGGVWGVAFSGDGRLVASGSEDGTVRLWETASGQLVRSLRAHTRSTHGVALSEDGRLVVSGSLDGTVRLWDAHSGETLAVLHGHTGGVRGVALSEDGRIVASGSLDGTVRLWSAENGRALAVLRGHVGLVYAVSLSSDGAQVASGSFDGTVKLWDTASGRLIANLQGYNRGIRTVATSRNGQRVVSGGFDSAVRVWDTASGALVHVLHGHASGIRDVAMSADARLVASSGYDGVIRLWDGESGHSIAAFPAHTGGVWGLALSGNGRLAASGGYDGAVHVWDIARTQLTVTLQGHASGIRSVALSHDGRLAASGSEDMSVRLWDTTTGQPLAVLSGHTGGIWSVALSDDGRIVASGSDDHTVRLWDAESGSPLRVLDGHTNAVWGVALTENGQTLVSASFDGTVRLWDVESGAHIAEMRGHDGRVCDVALDGRGLLAASAGVDGTVRVWETGRETGQHQMRHTLRPDRRYERLDITGLRGITGAQRDALLALGAVDRAAAPG